MNPFEQFDASRVPSPCFVVDRAGVEENLQVLARVQQQSGARVLAALKAFSCWSLAPLVSKYLSGVCASGVNEARLGREEYRGEVHTFSAAYREADIPLLCELSDHLVFNSVSQWLRFKPLIEQAQLKKPHLSIGLRVNPEHSEAEVEIYDPCSPRSRLGITAKELEGCPMEGIDGIHFHTLCEQGFEPLKRTLAAVEEKFKPWLEQAKWVNFGGGHHITKPGYDVEGLIGLIKDFAERYQVQVYLEPGEAVAIHTGVLVAEVLDVRRNGNLQQAILDTSATCHMPDTLEMPYRAEVLGAGKEGEKPFCYQLGGMSCLAGDQMGLYSFDQPLQLGQRLLFDDMSHYTMVKTTTFNGVPLPAIAIWDSRTDELQIVREFGYEDFKNRLS